MAKETLEKLGNLLFGVGDDGKEVVFDFTDEFYWMPGGFGDHGSCLWGSRTDAKARLYEIHAWAMRFWKVYDPQGPLVWPAACPEKGYEGYGRCFIIPSLISLEGFKKTGIPPEHLIEDKLLGYMMINGYSINGRTTEYFAELFSQHLGWPWKKMAFCTNGKMEGTELLYINAGKGMLLVPKEESFILSGDSEASLAMSSTVSKASQAKLHLLTCPKCHSTDHSATFIVDHNSSSFACNKCVECCDYCRGILREDNKVILSKPTKVNGCDAELTKLCRACRNLLFFTCNECKEEKLSHLKRQVDESFICIHCTEKLGYRICGRCGKLTKEKIEDEMCPTCMLYTKTFADVVARLKQVQSAGTVNFNITDASSIQYSSVLDYAAQYRPEG